MDSMVAEVANGMKIQSGVPTEQVQLLANLLPGIVWTAPPDGAADYVSEKWYAFTGCAREMPVGEAFFAALHPDDVERARASWAEAQRGGAPFDIELRLRSAQGEYHWFLTRGTPVMDRAGNITQWVGISTDITERKQAQAAVERYRLLLENARDVVWMARPDGRIVEVNQATEAAYGYSREELLRMNVGDLRHESTLPLLAGQLREACEGGVQFETVHVRRDGTAFPVEVNAGGAEIGGEQLVMSIIRDITDRKQTEEQLRRSEEQQAFLLKLSDRLRTLANPEEIQYQAACVLGEHLRANRVGYAEDQNDGVTVAVTRNYTSGVPGIEGCYRYEDYGPELLAELQAGRVVVRPDIANDPLLTAAEKEAHATLQLGATVNLPLVKAGRLTAILFIHCRQAHFWSAQELTLMQETAERTWDAVERARAEKALRAAHDTFRHLVEYSPFGIYVVDADFRLSQVSAGAQKVFENVRPLIGRNFAEVLRVVWAEPFAGEAIALFRQTLETGEPYRAPSTVKQRGDTGKVESYDWKIERIALPDGRFGVVCHFYDLSERQRYEAELRQSEERFRLASDAAGALVYDVDLTGRRHVIVHGLERVTGYPANDATLNSEWWHSLVHPEDLPAHRENLSRHLESGKHYRATYRIRRKDGAWIWVEDTARIVKDESGAPVQLVGAIVDITARREAEREQHKFVSLVENSTDFIATCDLDFKPTYANNAAFRLLGLKDRETARQLPFKDFFFSEDWEFIQQEFLPRVLSEGRAEAEIRLRNLRRGTATWVLYNLFKIHDEQGRPMGLATVSKNITERKLQEERQRESEERFRSMANTTPAIIWTAAPDGRITFHNQQWLDYTGLTPEQNEGNWADIVLHPDDYEPCLRAWRQALERGEKYEIEVRNRRRDGEYRWFLTRAVPVRNATGEIVSWFGSTTDIHEQKLAEEEIKTVNYRFRVAEEAARGLNYDWNLKTGAVTRSESVERVLGYSREEIGTTWQAWAALIHPDDRRVHSEAEAIEFLRQLPEDSFGGEYRVRHKDGHYVWVLERGLILRDKQGNIRRVIGQSVDISERKQLEAEREHLLAEEQKARAQAEAATHAKDEFLAVVTHELKTPLNSINGWAELLRGGKLSDDDARRAIDIIVRNAKVQKQLIDDLLDISRIIAGKMRLNVSDISLPEVLRAAAETVQHAAAAKHIQLRVSVEERQGEEETGRKGEGAGFSPFLPVPSSPRPPAPRFHVQGDFDRLQQVVWNLLANAIKFTPEHGRVEVMLRQRELKAEIVVRDTGKGIKPEFLPFVFDRFRQENAAKSRTEGGLGLGLAIVRQLVELHGGSVCAESAGTGQGAIFTVALPLCNEERSTEKEQAPQTANNDGGAGRIAGVRVLAVDDEPETRLLLRVILEGDGAEVKTTGSAADANALLDEWKPDVIVADIGLPDVDGYEFIQQVRKRSRELGGLLPAVALTAYSRTEDRVQALAAGYQAYVAKPVEPEDLLMIVASLTGRSTAR